MIRVDVEDYCHECRDFIANVTMTTRNVERNEWSDTIIQCEHRKRCAGLVRYLEHKLKTETEAVG